jgi:ABC-type nitrate/sulfonate/bicarbonate transport system permease component
VSHRGVIEQHSGSTESPSTRRQTVGTATSPVSDIGEPRPERRSPRRPSAARRVHHSVARSLADVAIAMIVPVGGVLLWWFVVAQGWFPNSVLPSPGEVASTLWDWIFGAEGSGPYSGTWLAAVWASAQRVVVGYLLSALIGVVLGVLIGYFRLFGRLFEPLIHILRPIPATAWVPLSLVFFGFGYRGAIFLVALGAFFPIVVNTIEGVRGANQSLVRVGRMLGAGDLRLLRYFIGPASLPSIFVGLRLGMGIAWVLVVVAELLSVKTGIGYTLIDAYSFGRYDVIIAAMVTLGALGFASDRVIVAIQRATLRWHQEVSIHGE